MHVGPSLLRLATEARSEVWDRYLRADLVEVLGLLPERSAAPLLKQLVVEGPVSEAYPKAVAALGSVGDVQAVPVLVQALEVKAKKWPESYVANIRRDAAVSLLQLGSLAGQKQLLGWLESFPPEDEGEERLRLVFERLMDASRHVESREPDSAWQAFGEELLRTLRKRLDVLQEFGKGESYEAGQAKQFALLVQQSLERWESARSGAASQG
jgi:HEAT repeat protein